MQIVAGNNTLNAQMIATVVTGTLSGTVTDAATGRALQGVTVTIGSTQVVTDASGNYTITGIPVGTYTVTFVKSGYNTLTL